MSKTFTHQQVLGANAKAIGDGRGQAFRDGPSAETAAAIVAAAVNNFATLAGLKPAAIIGALSAATGGKQVAKAGNPANPAPKADTPLAGPGFTKGELVRAKYAEDGKFYPAKFVSAKGDQITVTWVDGGAKDVILAADVRSAAKPAAAPKAQPAKALKALTAAPAPKAAAAAPKDGKAKAVPGAKGATVTKRPDPAAAPKAAPAPKRPAGKK